MGDTGTVLIGGLREVSRVMSLDEIIEGLLRVETDNGGGGGCYLEVMIICWTETVVARFLVNGLLSWRLEPVYDCMSHCAHEHSCTGVPPSINPTCDWCRTSLKILPIYNHFFSRDNLINTTL